MSTASRLADYDVTMTSEIHPGRRSTSKFFLHIISSNFSDPITIHHHAPSITDKPTQSNPTPTQLKRRAGSSISIDIEQIARRLPPKEHTSCRGVVSPARFISYHRQLHYFILRVKNHDTLRRPTCNCDRRP